MHVANVNPIRIVFITKLPNELIKFDAATYILEDLTVCSTPVNVCVQVESSPLNMLTTT